jgi:hypothetical protein
MTEDMLDEQNAYLTSLDDSRDERMKAQLDMLVADMQAFKVRERCSRSDWAFLRLRPRIPGRVWKTSCDGIRRGIGLQTRRDPTVCVLSVGSAFLQAVCCRIA